MNVIESTGLGKRYRRGWALRDCTLAIPGGRVAALVGPNGAGKTTLLHMSVGLTALTAGSVAVLGGEPAGSPAALDGIAFVAQDTPLYKNLSAADTLHLARNLNRRWDQRYARARLAELGIPLGKKVGKLSGGQQAQLALTLAWPGRGSARAGPAGRRTACPPSCPAGCRARPAGRGRTAGPTAGSGCGPGAGCRPRTGSCTAACPARRRRCRRARQASPRAHRRARPRNAVSAVRPTDMCSSVVLPAPFGPTSAATRPPGIASVQSRSAQPRR